MKVSDLREYLMETLHGQFAERVDSKDEVVQLVQQKGIVFIDEIDKIGSNREQGSRRSPGTDGVQRDLLPIIEGAKIQTKNGMVDTRHILFVCAGAFSVNKVTDLIPELLGRLPVQIELQSLTKEDFIQILTNIKNNLLNQYQAMLGVDNIQI